MNNLLLKDGKTVASFSTKIIIFNKNIIEYPLIKFYSKNKELIAHISASSEKIWFGYYSNNNWNHESIFLGIINNIKLDFIISNNFLISFNSSEPESLCNIQQISLKEINSFEICENENLNIEILSLDIQEYDNPIYLPESFDYQNDFISRIFEKNCYEKNSKMYSTFINEVIEYLNLFIINKSVLEVGPFNGELIKKLYNDKKYPSDYIGIEKSNYFYNKYLNNLSLTNCLFFNLDIKDFTIDKKFDIVLLNNVVYHFSSFINDIHNNISSLLKPNGKIYICNRVMNIISTLISDDEKKIFSDSYNFKNNSLYRKIKIPIFNIYDYLDSATIFFDIKQIKKFKTFILFELKLK